MRLIQRFLDWFSGRKDIEETNETKEAIKPPEIKIRTIQDVRNAVEIKTFRDVKAFCEEIRKTLTIYKHPCDKMREAYFVHKKAMDSLYVEVGNLSAKVDRVIESLERRD